MDIKEFSSINAINQNSNSVNFYKEEKEKENTICDSSDNKLDLIKQETTQLDEMNEPFNILMNVTSSNYTCTICSKQFLTKLKFEQHCLLHGVNKQNSVNCNNLSLSHHLKRDESRIKYYFFILE